MTVGQKSPPRTHVPVLPVDIPAVPGGKREETKREEAMLADDEFSDEYGLT